MQATTGAANMNASQGYRNVQRQQADALVREHAPLVRRIAYHLMGRLPASVEVGDLIQAGMIGLLDAARNFAPARAASFETYAGIRIRGAMLDELRKTDWTPRSVHRRAREIAEAIHQIESETGRDASETEVAQRLGIGIEDYHQALADAASCRLLSLDGHGDGEDDEGFEVADAGTLEPAQALEHGGRAQALAQAIGELPEREKLVMSLYYDDELNLKEIGAVLGVTESRVCQIHGQALTRLRARLVDWRT